MVNSVDESRIFRECFPEVRRRVPDPGLPSGQDPPHQVVCTCRVLTSNGLLARVRCLFQAVGSEIRLGDTEPNITVGRSLPAELDEAVQGVRLDGRKRIGKLSGHYGERK